MFIAFFMAVLGPLTSRLELGRTSLYIQRTSSEDNYCSSSIEGVKEIAKRSRLRKWAPTLGLEARYHFLS